MTAIGGDGKFNIEKGQGLSQAIVKELEIEEGSAEAKKLNSVWGQIFSLVERENNERVADKKIYSGESDLTGSTAKNFVMTIGQAVDLSNIWEDIKNLVQNAGAKMNPTPSDDGDSGDVDTTNTGTPNATATLVRTKKEGEDLATELRNSFKDPDVNILIGQLAKITPENVAYVLDKYKSFYAEGIGDAASLAGRIRGINAMGNGFDKKEVGLYIVRPLLIRANALDIECDLMNGKNIEDLSLREMCEVIRELQPKIVDADEENFVPQQNANYNNAMEALKNGIVYKITAQPQVGVKEIELTSGVHMCVVYGSNNEIVDVTIELEKLHQLIGYEKESKKPETNNRFEITFNEEGVHSDQDYNNDIKEFLSVKDYNFETIKALVQALLDKQVSS